MELKIDDETATTFIALALYIALDKQGVASDADTKAICSPEGQSQVLVDGYVDFPKVAKAVLGEVKKWEVSPPPHPRWWLGESGAKKQ